MTNAPCGIEGRDRPGGRILPSPTALHPRRDGDPQDGGRLPEPRPELHPDRGPRCGDGLEAVLPRDDRAEGRRTRRAHLSRGGGREDPWGEASARGAGEAAPACVPEAPGRGNESYRVPGIQLPLAAVCGEIALR